MDAHAIGSMDKLDALLEEGKIDEDEYMRLANAMRRPAKEKRANAERATRVERDPDDAILGGFCAAIAHYFGVDPLIVRVVTVVACLIIPFLIPLYFVASAAIPFSDAEAGEKLRKEAKPVRLSAIFFIVGFALPYAYATLIMPSIMETLENTGVRLWSSDYQQTIVGMSFDAFTMYSYSPKLLVAGIWLVTAASLAFVHYASCNARFRRWYPRVLIWAGFAWLAFLISGTLIALLNAQAGY